MRRESSFKPAIRPNCCKVITAEHADAIVPNFHPPAAETIDKSGPLTVVWIANLKPWKRPEVFVRLAQSFSDRKDTRFIMVGAPAAASGKGGWQASLMRSIEATPNLTYLGHMSHAEVNELLARAHIFVNTSTQEGFPNTFIQAWLRDVVVVSLERGSRSGIGSRAGRHRRRSPKRA